MVSESKADFYQYFDCMYPKLTLRNTFFNIANTCLQLCNCKGVYTRRRGGAGGAKVRCRYSPLDMYGCVVVYTYRGAVATNTMAIASVVASGAM